MNDMITKCDNCGQLTAVGSYCGDCTAEIRLYERQSSAARQNLA